MSCIRASNFPLLLHQAFSTPYQVPCLLCPRSHTLPFSSLNRHLAAIAASSAALYPSAVLPSSPPGLLSPLGSSLLITPSQPFKMVSASSASSSLTLEHLRASVSVLQAVAQPPASHSLLSPAPPPFQSTLSTVSNIAVQRQTKWQAE